jgi:hypothetical protein
LNDDVEQLELWSQKNKPNLATPWGKRVDSLLRLLKKQRGHVIKLDSKLEEGMLEDSMNIAIEIDRGKKYAQSLRR